MSVPLASAHGQNDIFYFEALYCNESQQVFRWSEIASNREENTHCESNTKRLTNKLLLNSQDIMNIYLVFCVTDHKSWVTHTKQFATLPVFGETRAAERTVCDRRQDTGRCRTGPSVSILFFFFVFTSTTVFSGDGCVEALQKMMHNMSSAVEFSVAKQRRRHESDDFLQFQNVFFFFGERRREHNVHNHILAK